MSSPPDISTLSLHSRPSQQRLHDAYDYDGNNHNRYFATTQGLPSQYNPLTGIGSSPLKSKPIRSGLPAVSLLSFFLCYHFSNFQSNTSNGLRIIPRTAVHCHPIIIRIFLPLAVHLLLFMSIHLLHLLNLLVPIPSNYKTTKSSQQPLSLRIYLLT